VVCHLVVACFIRAAAQRATHTHTRILRTRSPPPHTHTSNSTMARASVVLAACLLVALVASASALDIVVKECVSYGAWEVSGGWGRWVMPAREPRSLRYP
jgi:hypothetical protein